MTHRANITTDIAAVSNVLTRAFSSTPVTAYVVREKDSQWPAPNVPIHILGPKMLQWTTYKAELGCEMVEAGDYAAVAIWFPPGVHLPASPDDDERLVEYRQVSGEIKKRFIKERQYWYLNMIGRHPDRTEPGVIRALMDPYIARAKAEGVPVWLEAASDHSKKVYEHFGFKEVAEFRIGVGRATPQGDFQAGGNGILLSAMILE